MSRLNSILGIIPSLIKLKESWFPETISQDVIQVVTELEDKYGQEYVRTILFAHIAESIENGREIPEVAGSNIYTA